MYYYILYIVLFLSIDLPVVAMNNITNHMVNNIDSITHNIEEIIQNFRNNMEYEKMEIERKKNDLKRQIEDTNDLVLKQLYADEFRKLSQEQEKRDNLDNQAMDIGLGVTKRMADVAFDQVNFERNKALQREKVAIEEAMRGKNNLERLQLLTSPEKLKAFGFFATGLTFGCYGVYKTLSLVAKKIELSMGKPSLVLESSRTSVMESLLYSWGLRKSKQVITRDYFSKVVFHESLKTNICKLAQSTRQANKLGIPLRNVLLYGPPGTGKTMVARLIAQYADMDYAIISGANFAQFKEGQDVHELNKLFEWADKSPKGLVLFIDEADAFLRKRTLLDNRGVNLVNTFLSRTGDLSKKIMFIFATNYKDVLDDAVISRIHVTLSVGLPGLEQRADLLTMYLKDYSYIPGTNNLVLHIDESVFDQDFIFEMAGLLDGYSGRSISYLLNDLRTEVCIDPTLTIDKPYLKDFIIKHSAQTIKV